MRILWLADYTTREVPAGGAEITDSHIIGAGLSLGYEISVVRPNQYVRGQEKTVDLVILSNNFEFADDVRAKIIKTVPYAAYSHDIGRWGDVVRRNPTIFENAKASIFLSPGHRDKFKKYLSGATNIFCVPPHIPACFYDRGLERQERIVYAGNLYDGKGLHNLIGFISSNPKVCVDFYYKRHSSGILSQLKSNRRCHLKGYIPAEELYMIFNQYRYFVHLPREYEAFGRAVAEAYLSGCGLIVNDKIGALSYGWDQRQFREETLYAHYRFWDIIGSLQQ